MTNSQLHVTTPSFNTTASELSKAWNRSAIAPERTRLALFTNSIAIGGMEEVIRLIAKQMDRSKFEVYAISPYWERTVDFCEALTATTDHSVYITPDARHGRWRQFTETIKLFRQLRSWKIEVMHMHSTTYRGQVVALLAARLAGVRKIYVSEHLASYQPDSRLGLWWRGIFTRMTNGIVSVSQKNHDTRAARIYTPPEKSYVVNNGLDMGRFKPVPAETLAAMRVEYNLPAGATIIGTTVRFEPEKGLEYLLEAMPAILKACPNTYLMMVGDGSIRQELEAQAERLGISERVRWPGFQSNPIPFFGLFEAFVLPVPAGSMSIALLEAMAMGVPSVMTFGGAGEAVINGVNGFCPEPRNPAALAEAVIKIVQNPELRQRLSQAARQQIEQEFSIEANALKLEKIYLQGLSQN